MPPATATTPTLSSFQGADEYPMSEGGNWFSPFGVGTVDEHCQLVDASNSAERVGTPSTSWWSTEATTPEVWGKLRGVNAPGNNGEYIGLLLHGSADAATASVDCYRCYQGNFGAGGDRWVIEKWTNGSVTPLVSNLTAKIGGGDYMIFYRDGNDLVWGYEEDSSGVFTEKARVTDTTYTGDGFIGIVIGTDDTGYTEFGGGVEGERKPQVMRYA